MRRSRRILVREDRERDIAWLECKQCGAQSRAYTLSLPSHLGDALPTPYERGCDRCDRADVIQWGVTVIGVSVIVLLIEWVGILAYFIGMPAAEALAFFAWLGVLGAGATLLVMGSRGPE